jgi:putative methyltransferase (TIGR04325 family)
MLPPILILFARELKNVLMRAGKSPEISGYENPVLVKAVISRSIKAKQQIVLERTLKIDSFRVFLPFALAKSEISKVIELGGGAGYHYYNAKEARANQELDWVIVETGEMCAQASTNQELAEVSFRPNLEAAFEKLSRGVDLVYCSRALQYFPDPIAVIEKVCEFKPKYLFFTGIAFSHNENMHCMSQNSVLSSNGPQNATEEERKTIVHYELNLIPRKKFEEILNVGYTIELRTKEEPGVHYFEGHEIPYEGIWAVRKGLA